MVQYYYECNDCKSNAHDTHADKLEEDLLGEKILPRDLYEALVLFETTHSINPSKDELLAATICPRCGSNNCTKTMYNCNVHGYVRGYGWLDKAGVKRDMHRYTLANNDPYAQYRVPGEVEHIDTNLKKEGQRKSKRKYFSKRRS